MKKFLVSLSVFLFLLSGCSNNSTSPTEEQPEILPKNMYKFDVKTEFKDKIQSAGAKSGLSSYLKKSGWADIGDIGEDFSLWIINLTRTHKSDGNVVVEFNLEMRTRAGVTDGDLIADCRKHFKIQYNPDDELDDISKPLTPDAVMRGINSVIDIGSNSPMSKLPGIKVWVSSAKAISELLTVILGFIDAGTEKEQKAEAVYVGMYCYSQVKDWILTIEKAKMK